MRCFVGVILFLVLYFGSCHLLREGVAAMTFRSGQGYTQKESQRAGTQAVKKYHALVAVGTGLVALLACSLPSLLLKMSERQPEWQSFDER